MTSEVARHVDTKGLRFLHAVEYYGGEASMTDIRQRTGLSRDAANHRFRRLEELGLISVTYADQGFGNRSPPKVAHLTGTTRREIERGLFKPLRDESPGDGATVDLQAEVRALRKKSTRTNDDSIRSQRTSLRGTNWGNGSTRQRSIWTSLKPTSVIGTMPPSSTSGCFVRHWKMKDLTLAGILMRHQRDNNI